MKQKLLHRQKQTEKKTIQSKVKLQTQIQTQENMLRSTQSGNETREKALINYKSGEKRTELPILKSEIK